MKRQLVLILALIILSSSSSVRAQVQGGDPKSDSPVKLAPVEATDPTWLLLTRQIVENLNKYPDLYRPYGEDYPATEFSPEERQAYDSVESLGEQLDALPATEQVAGLKYVITSVTNKKANQYWLPLLLFGDIPPAHENVRFSLPYFEELGEIAKQLFLFNVASHGILARPEMVEFREFPRTILRKAARGDKVAPALVSQAALTVAPHTSTEEKQLIHQALSLDSKNAGLWNALNQLNDLTPAEVQKARQLFPASQGNLGWRLTLAVALSPYDTKMSDFVKQAVGKELKATGDIDIAAILLDPKAANKQQKLEASASIGAVAALNYWELKKALPYLFRVARANNPFVADKAVPILAVRAPQELLRMAKLPDARNRFMSLDSGVGLVGLLYPEFRPQARQILDSGLPQEEEFKGYDQVVAHLLDRGVLEAF